MSDVHVMFDLETLGKKPGCVVMSIGAVAFRLDGSQVSHDLYHTVSLQSSLHAGLGIEADTLEFWFKQSDAARQALFERPQPLLYVAAAFESWYANLTITEAPPRVWCHGLAFDVPIWEAAVKALDREPPWHYRAVRDTRTFYEAMGFDPATVSHAPGYIEHHALHDARYQAACVCAAFMRLRP